MKILKVFCAIVGLLVAAQSQAAFVTLPEAGMDAVFSQASFGNTPVDIRFGAVTEIVAPSLLVIDNDTEIFQVFGFHVGAQNIVNFYFVDAINSCGVINVNFIGCGETPGQDFVVESTWAADATLGALLLAHELGHNLGLQHFLGSQYLMNPSLNGGSLLTSAEVATILLSPLVQMDEQRNRFIQINPVLIVASATNVPEPATVSLMLGGLLAVGLRSRRREPIATA